MTFTLSKRISNTLKNILLLAIASTLFACQETEETVDTPGTETAAEATSMADTVETRPAPTFYVIPPDVAQKRVWICEDESSDIFHKQNDCPVLVQCKGGFRNLSIHRAIETYGRYNCQVCSEDLDHIFDEDMVR